MTFQEWRRSALKLGRERFSSGSKKERLVIRKLYTGPKDVARGVAWGLMAGCLLSGIACLIIFLIQTV